MKRCPHLNKRYLCRSMPLYMYVILMLLISSCRIDGNSKGTVRLPLLVQGASSSKSINATENCKELVEPTNIQSFINSSMLDDHSLPLHHDANSHTAPLLQTSSPATVGTVLKRVYRRLFDPTAPSSSPSVVPSLDPSSTPSVEPTIFPSTKPSLIPSSHPSVKPTIHHRILRRYHQ